MYTIEYVNAQKRQINKLKKELSEQKRDTKCWKAAFDEVCKRLKDA
jgi:hypothetical protein